MARKTFDPNSLTVDFRQLMRLSVQDRINLFRQGGQSYFESLTPTQLAQLFPKYYQQQLPDIGKAVSGGTKGTGGPPSFAGGGGGAGTPTGTATPSPRTGGVGAVGAAPSTGSGTKTTTSTTQLPTTQKNSILEYLQKMTKQSEPTPTDLKPVQRLGGLTGNYAVDRKQRFETELQDRGLVARLYNTAKSEVGNNPREQQLFLETVFNRAMFSNKPIKSILAANYGYGAAATNTSITDDNYKRFSSGPLGSVMNGSNETKSATENVSNAPGNPLADNRSQRDRATGMWSGGARNKGEYHYNLGPDSRIPTSFGRKAHEYQKFLESGTGATDSDKPTSPGLTPSQKSEVRRNSSIMASSLEDPSKTFTKDSVSKLMKDGKKYFEINFDYPSAQETAKMIKDAGGTVVAYNRGQQNTEYNETYRNVDTVVSEMKRNGEKIQHLDNTEAQHMKYDEFKQIVEKAKAAGITIVPKNPHLDGPDRNNWIKLAKENPDLMKDIPYASIENVGRMDQNQINNLKEFQKLFPGVQLNGVDWAGNKPSKESIDTFTKNFGPVKLNPGSESSGKYVFGANAQEFPSQVSNIGVVQPQKTVAPPVPLPKQLTDSPQYQQFYKGLSDTERQEFDKVLPQAIGAGLNTEDLVKRMEEHNKKTAVTSKQPEGKPQQTVGAPTAYPSAVGATKGVTNLGAVDDWLMSRYSGGGTRWKDEAASKKYNLSVQDYVIRGIDPKIRMEMYELGQKFEKDTGKKFSINTGFRDDYRQSLITSGVRAVPGASQHGGSNVRPPNKEAIEQYGKNMAAYGNGGAFDSNPEFTSWLAKNRPADSGIAPTGLKITNDPFHVSDSFSREANRLGYGGSNEQKESFNKRFQTWYSGINDPNVQQGIIDRLSKEGYTISNQGTLQATQQQTVPIEKRGITAGMGPPPVSPTPMSSKDMGLTPSSSAPTATPATTAPSVEPQQQATATPAPSPESVKGPTSNEYGGEYQATSEDMSVIDNRTGQAQFTFNRDEQLSLQDGRLKVTPENRTNPDNLKPANQVAQPQQQQQSSYENAAGMFSGLQPRPQSPMTVTSQTNFYDRLQPASMPQNDGIMRAYAQSIGFHDTLGSNYGYGTAATIRNGYDTIIS